MAFLPFKRQFFCFQVVRYTASIYGMETCPNCMRDHNPAFDEAKSVGAVGIPCFVLEDGTVTLNPEDAGLRPRPIDEGAACNIDGSGC